MSPTQDILFFLSKSAELARARMVLYCKRTIYQHRWRSSDIMGISSDRFIEFIEFIDSMDSSDSKDSMESSWDSMDSV